MSIILRVTNALLAVIALCLVLIVVKLYDAVFVPSAQAQGTKPVVQEVHIVNPDLEVKVSGTGVPVYIVYRQVSGSFTDLPVREGVLVRQAH